MMKNIVYILFLCSFLCSESFDRYDSNFYKLRQVSDHELDYSSKDIFKSLIMPGWGQYSKGDYKKAFIFLCIESIAFGIYYNYNKKGIDKEELTKDFANQHWSFSNWIIDYYSFESSQHSYIFEKEESALYKELWGAGHKIDFFYEGVHYTTGKEFEDFYNNILCPNGHGECNEEILDDNSININKDHHYYENIGKYDHFFSGWDDNESIYEFKKTSGELIAMSPNKKKYRNDWELSASFNRVADYALYTIYTNHVISLVDILIFSKINKNSKFNYKISTIYNPNNKMSIGGVNLSIAW